MRRSASHVEIRALNKKDDSHMRIRPRKTNSPDMGTYEATKSDEFTKKMNPRWSMSKSR